MILRSWPSDALEVRADGREISGNIKYLKKGMLRSGQGRGRNERALGEVITPRAFDFTLREVAAGREDIKLLAAHDVTRPLATAASDTLKINNTRSQLQFVATLVDTQAAKDTIELIRTGIATGISFGFSLPPRRRVEEAVEMVREPATIEGVDFPPDEGVPGADIRVVKEAILREISVGVTFPVYRENQAELRAEGYLWDVPEPEPQRRAIWLL